MTNNRPNEILFLSMKFKIKCLQDGHQLLRMARKRMDAGHPCVWCKNNRQEPGHTRDCPKDGIWQVA